LSASELKISGLNYATPERSLEDNSSIFALFEKSFEDPLFLESSAFQLEYNETPGRFTDFSVIQNLPSICDPLSQTGRLPMLTTLARISSHVCFSGGRVIAIAVETKAKALKNFSIAIVGIAASLVGNIRFIVHTTCPQPQPLFYSTPLKYGT